MQATRILLVDRDELLLAELSEGLHRLGFRVDTCTTAEAALGRLTAEPEIAVVFTDVVMADCCGSQVLHDLHRKGGTRPVVAVTAHATLELVIAALRCEVADLLHKPVTAEELAATVGRLAGGAASTGLPACHTLGRQSAAGLLATPGVDLLMGEIEDRKAIFGSETFHNERWDVLLRLAAAPPPAVLRLHDVAAATGIGVRTVRRALADLVELGLVESGHDPDRRRRAYRLTEAARGRMERLLARLPAPH